MSKKEIVVFLQFWNLRLKRQPPARFNGWCVDSSPDVELRDSMLLPWCYKLPSVELLEGGEPERSAG